MSDPLTIFPCPACGHCVEESTYVDALRERAEIERAATLAVVERVRKMLRMGLAAQHACDIIEREAKGGER